MREGGERSLGHFAYSTARVSRMTVTLIWPGYVIVSSILLARCRAPAAGRQVVDLLGPHEDAHLATGLDGE